MSVGGISRVPVRPNDAPYDDRMNRWERAWNKVADLGAIAWAVLILVVLPILLFAYVFLGWRFPW